MSHTHEETESQLYVVVVNDEEQYALWPANRQPPCGWRVAHASDTREACLNYVKQVWTDMRPRSLRASVETATIADHA